MCIARKSDEIRALIFRKTPQAIYSAFTQGEAFDRQNSLMQPVKWTFLTGSGGTPYFGVPPVSFSVHKYFKVLSGKFKFLYVQYGQ